jgi:hypothetical protein
MTTITRDTWLLLSLAAIMLTLLGLFQTLGVLLTRDLVKRAIREQGCEPIQVRWRPFAAWARGRRMDSPLSPTAFDGTYADATGATHYARFLVWFWRSRVRWMPPV